MKKSPLEGVRVVSFVWQAAGPLASRMLAHHGAEVILVESSTRISGLRITQPITMGKTGRNASGYFNNINTGMLGISLNMALPKAREIARQLIAKSDVVINNFSKHAMQSWGLAYEDIIEFKPDIIMACLTVMGHSGPRSNVSGHGPSIQAASGLNHMTGFPHRPPVGLGTAYVDFGVNCYHAATAILSALHYRNRTGKGQFIDMSQYESTISTTAVAILDYTANGRVWTRQGNRSSCAAPHGVFRCQGDDRWCAIAVFTDEEWQALRRVMGDERLACDEHFASLPDRLENVEELEKLVEAWTQERPAEEAMRLLQEAGVPAGVVQNSEDLLTRDPQMNARGHYWTLEHPEMGQVICDGPAFRLSKTPGEVARPSPLLGQYNEYVCRQVLGMSEEETAQCAAAGVFD